MKNANFHLFAVFAVGIEHRKTVQKFVEYIPATAVQVTGHQLCAGTLAAEVELIQLRKVCIRGHSNSDIMLGKQLRPISRGRRRDHRNGLDLTSLQIYRGCKQTFACRCTLAILTATLRFISTTYCASDTACPRREGLDLIASLAESGVSTIKTFPTPDSAIFFAISLVRAPLPMSKIVACFSCTCADSPYTNSCRE